MNPAARNVLSAGLSSWLTGLVMLALMALLRIGLPVPLPALLALAVCTGGICFAPGLLPGKWVEKAYARALAVAGAIGLVFLSAVHAALPLALYAALLAAGLRRARHLPDGAGLVLAALLTGVYIFCKSHAEHYAGVFTPELAMLGVQHRDTLMHASFTNMIHAFGRITTGEGGLNFMPYHIAFDIWLGPVTDYLHLPALEATAYVLRGLVFPCIVLASLLAVPRGERRVGVPVCMLALLALLGSAEMLGMYSNWLSESHAFSLIFLMLALSCLPEIFRSTPSMAALAVFCLLAGVALAAKMTVGVLLLGMAAGMGLRRFGLRPPALLLLATAGAGAWYVLHYQLPGYAQNALSPLFFLRAFGPLILLSPLLPVLLLVWLQRRVAKLDNQDAWVGVALCAAGAICIPNLIAVVGGSGWYFLDVIRWVGIWALGLWVAQPAVLEAFPLLQEGQFAALHAASRARRNSPHAAWLLLVVLAAGDAAYGIRDAISMAQAEAQRQMAFWQLAPLKQGGGLLGRDVATITKQGYGAQLLQALGDVPRTGSIAVYIPKGSAYWRWPQQCDGYAGPLARTQGFFFQAMAGMPILNGVPYDEKPCGQRDSEFIFGLKALQPPADENNGWLCAEAHARGFTQLRILQEGPEPGFRTLDCL